jgi:NAD(P)-dependent dehydrogenase (short-subunit alcohol dehydrogenase family)
LRLLEADTRLVYCVDRLDEPSPDFFETEKRVGQFGGSIHYRQVDVQNAVGLDDSIAEIAAKHQRLDGLIAAAGVQYVSSALEYPSEKIGEVSRSSRSSMGTLTDLHR